MGFENLDKINGFLKAFEWINHKTNFGYSFAAISLPDCACPDEALASYIQSLYSPPPHYSYTSKSLGTLWRSELQSAFSTWLFSFQFDPYKNGFCLFDRNKNFSLSDDHGKQQMLDELLDEIEKVDVYREIMEIKIDIGQQLYEGVYNDYLLMGREGCLYFHFGVYD